MKHHLHGAAQVFSKCLTQIKVQGDDFRQETRWTCHHGYGVTRGVGRQVCTRTVSKKEDQGDVATDATCYP